MRSRRVALQAGDMLPSFAAILAAEQPGRLDAGIEATRAAGHTPHRFDRLVARLVREPGARMGPAGAAIGRFPDRRAEPFIAAAAVDRAGLGIADHVVDRPRLAERAAQPPGDARRVAF